MTNMEFADYVALGIELMQERDTNSWALGDLAVGFEITVGRPSADDDSPTLGDLASGWNVSAQRVSEWRNVARFYPPEARTYDVPWEMYNLARRNSDDDLDNALELLDFAEQMHMTVAAFRRHLNGTRWEGTIPRHALPLWLQGLLPPSEGEFWVQIKRAHQEDET